MKKKTVLIIIIAFLVIVFISITSYVLLFRKPLLFKSMEIKVNVLDDAQITSYFQENKYTKLLSDPLIDTKSVGSKNINVKIKYFLHTLNYKMKVLVVDNEPPLIENVHDLSTKKGLSIDLLKDISVKDNSLEEIKVNVLGDYDFMKEGEYHLEYQAIDASQNETRKSFILTVINDPNNTTYKTSKGFNMVIQNGVATIDGILIVNKSYSLPSNYGNGITKSTNEAFNKMVSAAKNEGMRIYCVSGFRSYNDQKYIYNNYVRQDGRDNADTYSARPGNSEHQSGMAMDLNNVNDSFKDTNEGKWLASNAYLYGFILRYPEGKQSITGYKFEPWHYRYVGVDLAKKLYNNGQWITMEEYFGIDSKY